MSIKHYKYFAIGVSLALSFIVTSSWAAVPDTSICDPGSSSNGSGGCYNDATDIMKGLPENIPKSTFKCEWALRTDQMIEVTQVTSEGKGECSTGDNNDCSLTCPPNMVLYDYYHKRDPYGVMERVLGIPVPTTTKLKKPSSFFCAPFTMDCGWDK